MKVTIISSITVFLYNFIIVDVIMSMDLFTSSAKRCESDCMTMKIYKRMLSLMLTQY